MSRVSYLFSMTAFTALFLIAFIFNVEPVFAATAYYVDDNCPRPGYSGTINDPFCTIQAGINTALAGDTVQVSAGTYKEHIIMKNGVILNGAGAGDNPSVNSIINGGGTVTLVTANSINSKSRLDGFYITNGHGVGGGGMTNLSSSPRLTNCTFSENTVLNKGGGIYNEVSSYPTMINSIMWSNTPDEVSNNSESSLNATFSNIGGGYSGQGNINADPMFMDSANGDFHLRLDSPCIDAGDNSAVYLPAKDMDGDNRKINNPSVADTGNGTPPAVDMGNDEYYDINCDAFPWELFYPAFMKKNLKEI